MKNILRFVGVLTILAVVASCSSSIRFANNDVNNKGGDPTRGRAVEQANTNPLETPAGENFTGYASYYGPKFHGRKTANGEIFDQGKLTAAHRELPFNTKVKVTNLQNNRTVVVRINDRGPFVAGRVIDLSKKAAEYLDMINVGVAPVRVEILN